ncbi:MAG: hydroxypyruvate isomerase family protein [Pigmentiphaga sp.]|uniref:hydroxypyruvate isomerase family protein n=1 Tax=Pigmentiphaga sp. TaxID=1977564 RepID=UPI003B5823BF
MLALAANISMLFTELPFADRFAAAAAAGFSAVEFAHTEELSVDAIGNALARNHLAQVLATLPSTPGDKGLAAIAGAEAQFLQRLEEGLAAASEVGCPLVHITAGVVPDRDYESAKAVFHRNISNAVEVAERRGITLVIEAINQHDVPGYFVRSLADAVGWVDRIAHPRLRVLVDFYHAHQEGVPVSSTLQAVKTHGAHVQVAGAPGRSEPDTGQLDYAHVLRQLALEDYRGWIGCEYRPAASTAAGLPWREKLMPAAAHPRELARKEQLQCFKETPQ